LIVNRDAPPFDNLDLRRAMALTLDRRSFIDALSGGQGDVCDGVVPWSRNRQLRLAVSDCSSR